MGGDREGGIRIRFEVEDTGIGIPPEKLQEIFEPFQQVRNHLVQAEGTGLGLTISQRLVHMMGGQLQVQSTPGQGSMFWFDLELPVIEGVIANEVKQSRPVTGFKGDRRSILIVDDNSENRLVLKDLLTPLKFDILEAVDGRDALEQATARCPDLILMDLVMPEMGGVENLYALLGNLLTWARIQQGAIECHPQSLDLHYVVNRNVTFFTSNVERK